MEVDNNSSCSSNCASIAVQQREEVGFFFLKNTAISLIIPGSSHDNESSPSCGIFENNNSVLPYSKDWVNVVIKADHASAGSSRTCSEEEDVVHEDEDEACVNKSAEGLDIANANTTATTRVCPRCSLVLYCSGDKDDETITMHPSAECYFDGTLSDIQGCCNDNDSHTNNNNNSNSDKKKQRSDAILCVGTILNCQSLGFLRIESFKVLCSGIVEKIEDEITVVNASIAITVSLPLLEELSNTTVTSFLSRQNNCYDDEHLSIYSKGFPHCGQLLFTLIRSDWDWLDATMEEIREENRNMCAATSLHHHHLSFNNAAMRNNHNHNDYQAEKNIFPKALTLEESYSRLSISTASDTTSQSYKKINICSSSGTKRKDLGAGILSLPEELLVYKLAPFLRAKSLDNLRLTCRYLHHVLRAVVPGLNLQLFPHQINSLSWMRQREEHFMTEYDAMNLGPDNNNNHHHHVRRVDEILHGDVFRSVTCGGVVSIAPRRRMECRGCFWLVNAWSGECWMNCRHYRRRQHHYDKIIAVAQNRKVARGGLLCDDPGLGKTITVLSLILQTCGLSTEKISSHNESIGIRDQDVIEAYWREMLVSQTRKDELSGLTLKLRKCDPEQIFQYPVFDVLLDHEKDLYNRLIKTPICMEDVNHNIRNNFYDGSFESVANDICQIYQNAISYNPPDSIVHEKAQAMKRKMYAIFHEFRQKQLILATGAAKRSNGILGSLIRQKRQNELMETLLPSRGTLLVVPSTLVQHWVEQINLHINFSALSSKPLLIFIHRRHTSFVRYSSHNVETSDYTMYEELCCIKKSHFPFLFIDEITQNLPPEQCLASFLIVLTTTKRFTTEWKNGSFEEELRRDKSNKSFREFNYDASNEYGYPSPCPLLKINWLRLIVDEGHTMGKRGQPTNAIDFASWIFAERRWAMTGTPTPQSIDKDGLGNLFGLLKYLKHDLFTVEHWGEERCKLIMKELKAGNVATFFKLRHLLNLFMIRHTKLDVVQLYKPILKVTRMEMSIPEILAYNTLVSAVQMNLVATSMKGRTSGKQDSLLSARNVKHARQALSNIRLACCGGTHIVPDLSYENKDETMNLMRTKHKADDLTMTLVDNFLERMKNEQLSSCMACGIQLQTLFLLPCGCQICTECVTSDTKVCLVCHREFDVDDFQKLQPGLEYQWKWNIDSQENRGHSSLVSQSLVQMHRDHQESDPMQDVDFHRIQNDISNPALPQRANRRRRNAKHACQFPTMYRNGKCLICFQPHECVLHETLECNICHNKAEECPQEESKAFYISNRLKHLWYQYKDRGTTSTGESKRPLKVLIFSQFRQISNVVGDRLIRRFGLGCIAEYWGQARNLELQKFTLSNDCFCMLLAKEGSHGLNLSFVTHIFFLDEILDKSLECQVVARAYRMGATENVYVEQLVAKHSIEELIVKMNKRDGQHNDMYSKDGSQENEFMSEYYEVKDPPNVSVDATATITTTTTSGNTNSNNRNRVGFLLTNVKIIKPHPIHGGKRKAEKHKDHKKKRIVQFVV
eukprot:CAMPEP_0176494518 /NCGR_PEP_ID=MMETSP0200_2-20121128/10149_1 /TAXON_ID=947934 /ORGANISM="Chaetoceros sp., Strain GSL56" /LENGTH=1522 /DNA_ID=CAMNT_0017892301 /DNA_START=84 /DNA_END=4652 /DNA_ORIENTATION=-